MTRRQVFARVQSRENGVQGFVQRGSNYEEMSYRGVERETTVVSIQLCEEEPYFMTELSVFQTIRTEFCTAE
jgi:hypothetical protein